MENAKIIIAGIGAVGGFFGGKLAAHYRQAPGADILFLARGENEKRIREGGLKLETTRGNFTAHPAKVSSNPAELGPADLIICCTKSYDLEESIEQLMPCITPQTIILPLLNGVDARERIKKLLPDNEVWDGCVFIISRLAEPGLIRETGNISKLLFGATEGTPEKLEWAETLFSEAGIDVRLTEDILEGIWKKFSFISPVATLTSYLDTTIGDILQNPEYNELLLSLLQEIKAVADAKGIQLPADIIDHNIKLMSTVPADSTSSMHSDFQKGKATEVESLTGHIVRLGKDLQVPTPVYEMMYQALLEKEKAVK